MTVLLVTVFRLNANPPRRTLNCLDS